MIATRIDVLSHAERRILPLLANGYTNLEIGTLLGLTEQTIKFHLHHVYAKLGVRNRVEAAVLWVREQEKGV